jgi:hypothetical protein
MLLLLMMMRMMMTTTTMTDTILSQGQNTQSNAKCRIYATEVTTSNISDRNTLFPDNCLQHVPLTFVKKIAYCGNHA